MVKGDTPHIRQPRAEGMTTATTAKLTAYVCPKLSAALSMIQEFIEELKNHMNRLEASRENISAHTFNIEMNACRNLVRTAMEILDDIAEAHNNLCTSLQFSMPAVYRAYHILRRVYNRLYYSDTPRIPVSIRSLIYEAYSRLSKMIYGEQPP